MKRYLVAFIIEKMQIETTLQYHCIPTRTLNKKKRISSAGDNVEQMGPFHINDGCVNRHNHLGSPFGIVYYSYSRAYL